MITNPNVARNQFRNAVRREAPEEFQLWLDDFERELQTEADPERLLNKFAMLGAEDPEACLCGDPPFTEASLRWYHRNHRVCNGSVWEIIRNSGTMMMFRMMCFREWRLVAGDDPRFGRVIQKNYAALLLNKFFVERPEWVFGPPEPK